MRTATARAYSSSANLASGFDIMAVCIDAFHDTVEIRSTTSFNGVRIVSDSPVPLDPERNSASIPVITMMNDFDVRDNLEIRIRKGIPLSAGMGGSGSCAVAATRAFDTLYSLELSDEEIAAYAALGEKASGAVHYDNVVASTVGELTFVLGKNPVKLKRVTIPEYIRFITVTPLSVLKRNTASMRTILPGSIPMEDHVNNSRFLSSLITGFLTEDRDLIRNGLNDGIVEPVRSQSYSYYTDIRKIPEKTGALGAFISGSGPSVVIVCDDMCDIRESVRLAGRVMDSSKKESIIKVARVAGGAKIEN